MPNVSVKLDGDIILDAIPLEPSDRVGLLLEKARSALHSSCTLTFNGLELKENATIEECELVDGAVVQAVIHKDEALIVGAGVAGLQAAADLARSKKFNITLVDAKDYFEYSPSIMHAYFDPAHHEAISFDLEPVLKEIGVTFVRGEVTQLHERTCVYKSRSGDEQVLNFDYCVVAKGCAYNPFKPGESLWMPSIHEEIRSASSWRSIDERTIEGRRQHLRETNDQLRRWEAEEAEVIVVGAGYLGVQFATGLKHYFPRLSVTITDFQPRCLVPLPTTASQYCQDYMDKVGIKCHYSVKYDGKNPRFWERVGLPQGPASVHEFICMGVKASHNLLPADMLSKSGPGGGGWLLFNSYLQVVDPTGAKWSDGRVFTVGDCTFGGIATTGKRPEEWELPPIPKCLIASQVQAINACKNIIAMASGSTLLEKHLWPEQSGTFEIALGVEDGCVVKGNTYVKDSGTLHCTGAKAVKEKTRRERDTVKTYQKLVVPPKPNAPQASCFSCFACGR